MVKNEIYEIEIVDMGNDGEGIGHVSDRQNGKSFAVFVKDTVIGDKARIRIVKVKKTYAYGRLEELIRPSADRTAPVCDKARSCGGCSLMHMSYEKQLEYKYNRVKSCLERIGCVTDTDKIMEPPHGMETPYFYRNKMQLPVGRNKDGNIVIGFYAGHTHSVINLERCYIGHPVNDYIIKHLRSWLENIDAESLLNAYDKKDNDSKTFGKEHKIKAGFQDIVYDEDTHTGLVRHILTRMGFATGELMVCLVINGECLPAKYKASFIESMQAAVEEYNRKASALIRLASLSVNINKEKTNKILGNKCITIYGKDCIEDYIGSNLFRISPLSFYQVNPVQTKAIYDKAIEYADLKGSEVVWDMYCGIGTISLSLAKKAKKVYGVEIIPEAISDAKENAKINNINNTEFFCGKAEAVVPEFYKQNLSRPDVVVVDPPRKGCDITLLETIISMSPDRIVYVSCDPATLARDIKILSENGYSPIKVSVFDAFCQSTHVETVVLLSHKSPDSHINVKVEFGEGEGKVPLDAIAERAKKYQPKPKITYKMI